MTLENLYKSPLRAEALSARIPALIADMSKLLSYLDKAMRYHPDRVTLAISFGNRDSERLPYVIAASPYGYYAMVPILPDTLKALGHLKGENDKLPFDIVTSSGTAEELLNEAVRLSESNGGQICYDSIKVSPQDYIAMAAWGLTSG